MATITKTYTENADSYDKSTWTVTATQSDITVSDSSFTVAPVVKAKYSGSHKGKAQAIMEAVDFLYGSTVVGGITGFYYPSSAQATGMADESKLGTLASGTTATLTRVGTATINTASCFTASNKTTRTINLTMRVYQMKFLSDNSDGAYYNKYEKETETSLGTICTVMLNAPPTFTHSSISYNTTYIYTGLTTASVTVSDLSAKYGGNITNVTFTIGNQSVSRTTEGALSILLDTAGTFTPTITVTDSRGQTATNALDPITVNGYVAPSVSFTAERTAQNGTDDDEGTYATVDATFRYTDVVATLQAPSVVLTDDTGAQTTPTVTWYKTRASDGTLSGAFTNWSTVAVGDTVYGLIPNVSTQYAYQISIRPRDTKGVGTVITQTLSGAFYTIDFLAGGHGIAFGQPATSVGFECNMTAIFHDTVDVEGILTGTDIVAEDMTSQEISDFIDSLNLHGGMTTQVGSVTLTSVGTTEKTASVTFTTPFTSTPIVVASLKFASYNRRIHVMDITANGFSVVGALLSGSGTASIWVDWIAIGW